ncbi:MAG: TerB family tellurite resistance protein [Gammaproteobacteria bacterium]
MIDKLLKFLGQSDDLPEDECVEQRIKHATAVLLVEIARADHNLSEAEMVKIRDELCAAFDVDGDEASALVERAHVAVEEAVSLHEFTRVLHAEMSYAEKESVIEMLWKIALVDFDLDKYEDYMIAKIADLLYIARGDVMRLKQRVWQGSE